MADRPDTDVAPLVSVVIVNYKVRDLLRECLRSLEHDLGRLRGEVWVVDNASGDGSVEMVKAEFPWVRLVANEQNRGYGAAIGWVGTFAMLAVVAVLFWAFRSRD